jgi:5-methylcytosine-specific restriction endonuclease McrA
MSRRLPNTPRSQIRSAIRRVWLRSRERAAALKRDRYTCQGCLRKQSKARGKEFSVEVHHKKGIANWEKLIDAFFEYVLVDPEHLQTLCKECHKNET